MTREAEPPQPVPRGALSLWDATAIGVGIVLGSGLYQSTPTVAACAPGIGVLLALWLAGALIALVGGLCYAELATRYPRDGGDYVYLTQAFGAWVGFLFVWSQLWIVRPGSIGAIAFVFARYLYELVPLAGPRNVVELAYAAGAILGLTAVQLLGLREGKWTQNLLASLKLTGLAGLFIVAFLQPRAELAATSTLTPNYPLAMIYIMFAYGGWNEIAFVAAELREPRRNVPKTLLLSVGVVAVVYLTANLAFAHALGYGRFQSATAVAAEVAQQAVGASGARLISALICISALGSINGQLIAGARIYAAFAGDQPGLRWLARWNVQKQTPYGAFLLQGLVTLIPVGLCSQGDQGFEQLVKFTTPVFWFFFLLVGVALPVLRARSQAAAPFLAPWYPWTPALFCASSLFMLHASVSYAIDNRSWEALWSIGVLGLGGIAWLCMPSRAESSRTGA